MQLQPRSKAGSTQTNNAERYDVQDVEPFLSYNYISRNNVSQSYQVNTLRRNTPGSCPRSRKTHREESACKTTHIPLFLSLSLFLDRMTRIAVLARLIPFGRKRRRTRWSGDRTEGGSPPRRSISWCTRGWRKIERHTHTEIEKDRH